MEEKGQRYDISRLRNPDVSKNFSIAVKNKYEALSNIDEEAENKGYRINLEDSKGEILACLRMCAREKMEKR